MAKCVECGYLAARQTRTINLSEVEQDFRERGQPVVVGTDHVSDPLPLCFEQGYDLKKEAQEFIPQKLVERQRIALLNRPDPEYIKRVLNEDRECESFTPWIQGFTPKEHR